MPNFGVGAGEMRANLADFFGVGPGVAHALLRATHFGGGDHLHRLGDLLRILNALDLIPNLLRGGHRPTPPPARRQKRTKRRARGFAAKAKTSDRQLA